jgi:hypothetical protein
MAERQSGLQQQLSQQQGLLQQRDSDGMLRQRPRPLKINLDLALVRNGSRTFRSAESLEQVTTM